MACINVEEVVREHNHLKAYELLSIMINRVRVRAPLLVKEKEIPPDMYETVSTIIFASSRICELDPQLKAVRKLLVDQFSKKHGGRVFVDEIESDIAENAAKWQINTKMRGYLLLKAPTPAEKFKYLDEILTEKNVSFDRKILMHAAGHAPTPKGTRPRAPVAVETPPPPHQGAEGGTFKHAASPKPAEASETQMAPPDLARAGPPPHQEAEGGTFKHAAPPEPAEASETQMAPPVHLNTPGPVYGRVTSGIETHMKSVAVWNENNLRRLRSGSVSENMSPLGSQLTGDVVQDDDEQNSCQSSELIERGSAQHAPDADGDIKEEGVDRIDSELTRDTTLSPKGVVETPEAPSSAASDPPPLADDLPSVPGGGGLAAIRRGDEDEDEEFLILFNKLKGASREEK